MNRGPTIPVPLDLIDQGERLRQVDPDWVGILAASIEERGLDSPIQVREPDQNGRYRLVSGAHRLSAFRALGRRSIPATVVHVDDLTARLAEIDENLIRRDLSDLDRAVFLSERKRVWEALHPQTRHGGGRRGRDQVAKVGDLIQRFSAEAARKLTCSERKIQRLLQRAERIPPHIRRMIGNTRVADSGAELDQLIRVAPELMDSVAEILRDGRAHTVRQAVAIASGETARERPTAPASDPARELAALQRAWQRASAAARQTFLEWVQGAADEQ